MFRMVVEASDEVQGRRALTAAFARVAELDSRLSHYLPGSELRGLRSGRNRVSRDLYEVLLAAQAISRASEGAFDVTVGPFVALWRRSSRQGELPSDQRLESARARVGYRYLSLLDTASGPIVELQRSGMQLDLGGIAKGHALDCALQVLVAHGISRALVDGGGDIVVGDPPMGERGWTVAVPLLGERHFVELKNAAIATSGDLHGHVEIYGVPYSHIIDPRTGLGCTDRSTVTVIATSGAEADALASAVSVLGFAKGQQLVESREGTFACGLNETGTFSSEGFPFEVVSESYHHE